MSPGAPYPLVLLDLDGTLVDSSLDMARSGNAMLEKLGRPTRPHNELIGFVGEGLRRFVARAVSCESNESAALVEEGIVQFREHYQRHLLDTTAPFPGIPAALNRLRDRGSRLAVITNKPEDMARSILEQLGLSELFEDVVGGDRSPRRKPDPSNLNLVMKANGVEPRLAVMVGDSIVDAASARNAGTALAVVTWGLGEQCALLAYAPEHVIEHAHQLGDLSAPDAPSR